MEDFINIFTDGSFCPNTGCSGFGICIQDKKPGFKKHKGRFHKTVRNSLTSELIAVCMGVIHAEKLTNSFKGYKDITIVTDAPGIREAFRRISEVHRDLFRLVNTAKRIMDLHGIKIRTIKGHQPKHSSMDAFLNHRCDVMAKREMRQWRDSEFPMVVDGLVTRRRERRINRAIEKANLRREIGTW